MSGYLFREDSGVFNFSQTEGDIQLGFLWRVWLAVANATRRRVPPARSGASTLALLPRTAGEITSHFATVRNDFTPAALVKAGERLSTNVEALTA